MSDSGADRREHPRFPIMIPVEYKDLSDFFVDYAIDISHGGMFIATDREIETGTQVEVKFKVPEFNTEFIAKGSVVRRGKVPKELEGNNVSGVGFGVKFDPMPPENRQIIEQMWKSKIQG